MLEVRKGSAKVVRAFAAVFAIVAFAASLVGCAAQAEDQLPRTHLDQKGEVAASHDRCGACHAGATRGNGVYESLDYTGIESLMGPEFATESNHVDPEIAESLYADSMNEGGEQ